MAHEITDGRLVFDQSFNFKGGNKVRVRGMRTMKSHVILQFAVGDDIATVNMTVTPDEAKAIGNALVDAGQKAEV
jgi:hypothetical protein